jgi:hypothetical protein
MAPRLQIVFLFVIALPVAAITWTVTHEELFREFREVCVERSAACKRLYARKFFYIFTCEYCFSHYVAGSLLLLTRFKMLFSDWRGYLIACLAMVWIANVYIALFARLRLDVREQRVNIEDKESY